MPVVESNPVINADAIVLRRKSGLEVPDSIIAASARFLGVPLLTSDKGFNKLKRQVEVILLQQG